MILPFLGMTVREMILAVIAIVTIVVSNFFPLNLKMPSSTILFIQFYRCLLWFANLFRFKWNSQGRWTLNTVPHVRRQELLDMKT